ncbi:DUF2971 domain-containing protein [Pedobacter sp. P26]|uniref:DUF2971 domain-containing protein n=1 Tax=Pedobacter sp. P26 TaxID=3423956 RepID=UPI003D67DE85
MDHLDFNIYSLLDEVNIQLSEIEGAVLIRPFITSQKNYTLVIEAAIFSNGEPLAIFDTRPYLEQISTNDIRNYQIVESTSFKYTIVTNGLQILLYNNDNTILSFLENARDLVEKIFDIPTDEELQGIKNEIAFVLQTEVNKFILNGKIPKQELSKYESVKELFNNERLKKHLHYNRSGQYFRLGKDITLDGNFENRLFNILLDDLPLDTLIYRYASLETVFATVDGNTIRMNGIAGMNDTSEVEYVDQYLDSTYTVFNNPAELKEMNRRFISCCSTVKDKLNQWRLYGDDCKGACLVFRIDKGGNLPGVKLKKVSYGTQQSSGIPYHLELELIKNLMEQVRLKIGQKLKFKSLGIWKHFFKPFEYTEESEVRLLLALNNTNRRIKGATESLERKWNLTYSHKIIAPFISVPIVNTLLPVTLEKITLGSKCPEKQLNHVQLKMLLEERGLLSVEVDFSGINNYR